MDFDSGEAAAFGRNLAVHLQPRNGYNGKRSGDQMVWLLRVKN